MLTLLLALSFGKAQSVPTHATLVAGTVVNGGTPLVRLRWSMDQGWIPDGGFNLYRATGSAAPVKLNAAPLKVDPSGATHPTVQLAMQPMAVVGQQAYLSTNTLPITSTAATFAKLRTTAQTAQATNTGEKGIRAALAASPDLNAHSALLPKATPHKTTFSQVEQVGMARSQLMIGSMSIPGFATKMGLGFDDTQVQNGAAYTYTLKAISGGTEGPVVATLAFTVGKDAVTPTPVVEQPFQTATGSISLHFELPPNVTEAAFGALWFNVTRIDTANPNGAPLTKSPLFPSYVQTTDGKQTIPLTTFVDRSAAPGPVKYVVTLEDAFLRLSPAVTVQTTLSDIASPAGVAGATAYVPGKLGAPNPVPTVTFYASAGDASQKLPNAEPVQYKVERMFSDVKGSPWTLVGSGPVDGTAVSAGTLPVRDLIHLSSAFRGKVLAACVPSGSTQAQAQSAMIKAESLKGSDLAAKYPALAPLVNAFVLKQVTDTSPGLDHYAVYRITPVLKRNGIVGDPAASKAVGVPAATPPSPPGNINLADAPAPADVSTIAGSKTNAIKMQSQSSTFPLSAAHRTGDSKAMGQQVLAAYYKARKLDATQLAKYNSVVPANYGRMVTLSWSSPGYSSPVSYKVYKGFGTGYFKGAGKAAVPAGTGVLAGRGVHGDFPKSHYLVNQAPTAKSYVLLGQTKPGETQFVDIIPRGFASTVYYYVVPVSRWKIAGAASAPASITVKESLPPSAPVVQSVVPGPANSMVATVQPNLISEDVVEYRLMRAPITPTATVTGTTEAGAAASGTAKGGKLVSAPLGRVVTSGVTMTYGGVTLATGADGNIGAKYGIVSHSSAGIAIATYRQAIASALAAKQTPPAPPSDLAPLFTPTPYTQVASVKPAAGSTAAVTLTDPSPVSGEEYVYCVVAVNGQGVVSDMGGFLDATLVRAVSDAPSVSAATYTLATNSVSFQISAPPTGATVFIVERQVAGGDWVHLATLQSSATGSVVFTDHRIHHGGQTYTYRVSTIDGAGVSSITTNGGQVAGYATTSVVVP